MTDRVSLAVGLLILCSAASPSATAADSFEGPTVVQADIDGSFRYQVFYTPTEDVYIGAFSYLDFGNTTAGIIAEG